MSERLALPIATSVRLLVVYQHAPTPGAPGIYRHRRLLTELAGRGWQVDLVCSPINYMHGHAPDEYRGVRWRQEHVDGVTHHWVPATGDVHRTMRRRALNYTTFAASSLARGISLPRPDVIWASSPPLSVATVGRLLARRFRRPWVFEVRDLWPETASAAGLLDEQSRLYRVIDRMARTYAREADAVIAPSPVLARQVIGHGASDVTVVTGAIEDTPADPRLRRQMRDRLGAGDDTCVFAYVGSHGIIYGLDRLLDAAELLVSDPHPANIRIVLAGDGSAREQLEQRLREHPLDFLTMLGPVPRQEVRTILSGADVGLHLLRPAPLFEGALPTKALEYLGSHLPFITTVPGLPQQVAIDSGGSCARSVEDLAGELRRWASMPATERAERGERAFEYGNSHYGLDATVDRLEALLMQTARGADTRRA